MKKATRRDFLADSAAVTLGAVAAVSVTPKTATAAASPGALDSPWEQCHDRAWLGPEYWANPLRDWRIARGRLECVNAAPNRNVQILTRDVGDALSDLRMRVRLGRVGGGALRGGRGSVGFRVGIRGPLDDYRNHLIFGEGIDAGLLSDGRLFIGDADRASDGAIGDDLEAIELRLSAETIGGVHRVTLSAHRPDIDEALATISRDDIPAEQLVGNLALVANYRLGERQASGADRFWFADWRVAGERVEAHDNRAFGPILFSQYTLSDGVMKMTAQMPPLAEQDSQTVRLDVKKSSDGEWSTLGEETIHTEARTATFRVANWNASQDIPYRLVYTMHSSDGRVTEHEWTGTVRRDPVDEPVLTVADVSCNYHTAFPNAPYTAYMAKADPDLLAFVGDQFYETTGGFHIAVKPLATAILDYLQKWYMHGWTWRDLTRDRPSISLPDDHDVYQGNVWGEAGAARNGTQEMGGYDMQAAWVNVVHRTQTSHHPDPFDPTPIKRETSVYYGPMTYGRVSFAVLADRMFKSGPEGKVPPTELRGDHVTDPNFDPSTADVPGATLLGERQMDFVRQWVADWRGADMKAVVSQTIFTAMATTHGPERQRLVADYDSNAWPQTPRNEAVREIRKAFAVHIAGDQHLPAVVHYGVDKHGDAPRAFAGPAVNTGYPRWFEPEKPGRNRAPGAPEETGEFIDSFGHPLTVLAVRNPAVNPRRPVIEFLTDKSSGLGLVRFDKPRRRITFECWPFLTDPTDPASEQFPGWPVAFDMLENYGRAAVGWLPKLDIRGVDNPVVQVIEESTGEMVYILRVGASEFHPKVFALGRYTVVVSEPDAGREKRLTGLEARAANDESLIVEL